MKRVTIALTPSLLVDDDADSSVVFELEQQLVSALLKFDKVESVNSGERTESTVREGVCKVGAHDFVLDRYFPASKPVPDICRMHWYAVLVQGVTDDHAPLFDEVRRLTGLEGFVENTGGNTMTIFIPFERAADGQYQPPMYTGLQEGVDEDTGLWYGGVSFVATEEDYENGVGYVSVAGEQTPQEWAAAIAAHYEAYKADNPDKD